MLERAVKDYGYASDAYELGLIYIRGRKFREAEDFFKARADGGDDMCATCLGELYSPMEGEVTGLEDGAKAVEVFQAIIDRNPRHRFALYGLARLYHTGSGVPVDVARAKELYRRAMAPEEQSPVIKCYEKDAPEIVVEKRSVGFWIALAVPVWLVGVLLGVRFLTARRKT
jgi:TPR repeat protein